MITQRRAQSGLAVLLFAAVACNRSEHVEHQEPAEAAPTPAAPAPAAPPSTSQAAAAAEVRVPRETATKLVDLCESPAQEGQRDPEAADPSGEKAVLDPQKGVAGARLFGIRPDSPLAKATLQNGDRVINISGVEPGAPKERWDAIRKSNRLDVRLIRRGAPMSIALIVE